MNESLFGLAKQHFSARPTGILYHYTSLKGLMGIIESKTLFATDVKFLNDMSEVLHLFKLMESARFEGKAFRT